MIYSDQKLDGSLVNIRDSAECGSSISNDPMFNTIRVILTRWPDPITDGPGPYRRNAITGIPETSIADRAKWEEKEAPKRTLKTKLATLGLTEDEIKILGL